MFYIRADGNASAGAGHIMRCLTIAEEIGKREEVTFLCADISSGDFVKSHGQNCLVLGAAPFSEEEARLIGKVMRQPAARDNAGRGIEESEQGSAGRDTEGSGQGSAGGDTEGSEQGSAGRGIEDSEQGSVRDSVEGARLLIDSYLATPVYVEYIRQCSSALVFVMDDLGRQAFPADVVINYNVFAKEERYRRLYGQEGKEAECVRRVRFLIGSRYIPIRSQFTTAQPAMTHPATTHLATAQPAMTHPATTHPATVQPATARPAAAQSAVRDRVESILITTGGGDVDNLAGSILRRLLETESARNLHFHVVSGVFNPHFGELEKLAEERNNVTVHKNVENMAGLMSACDMAVTAGGTTVYELCALGIPFVCFSYADNQDALVAYIGEQGIALSAGTMVTGQDRPRGVSLREGGNGACEDCQDRPRGVSLMAGAPGGWQESREEARARVIGEIARQTDRLIRSVELRQECSRKERELVDGQGAARLAARLCGDMQSRTDSTQHGNVQRRRAEAEKI